MGGTMQGLGMRVFVELSYIPNRLSDGSVDVDKAIEIFHQFEHSKQLWGYAVRKGMIEQPTDFINAVPHISFVYGQEQVDFLRDRHAGIEARTIFLLRWNTPKIGIRSMSGRLSF